jgi:hypothetical protein
VLRAGDAVISDVGDAFERDPEVRRARTIADAARKRLVACVTGAQEVIDPAEAQRMLDAFRCAVAHAEDAEDRVLLHRGLLTSVEAGRRAARRRPVAGGPSGTKPDGPTRAGRVTDVVRSARRVRRGGVVARVVACALALVAAGSVGMALARWLGVRPPQARW